MTRPMEQAAVKESVPDTPVDAEAKVAAAPEAAPEAATPPTEATSDAVADAPAAAATAAAAAPIDAVFEPVKEAAAGQPGVDTGRHHAIRSMQNRLEALGDDAVVVRMQAKPSQPSGGDDAIAPIAGRSGAAAGARGEPQGRIPPISLRAGQKSAVRGSGDTLNDAPEPWDRETAEALARIHEIEERSTLPRTPDTDFPRQLTAPRPAAAGGFASMSKGPPVSLSAPPSRNTYAAPAPFQSPARELTPVRPAVQAMSPAHQTSVARAEQYDLDKAWIDEQMNALAARFEKSLTSLRPDVTVEALSTRFSEFEERLATALDGVAMRSDLENMAVLEQHIVELSGHMDQTQSQLERLNGIESRLQTVVEQLASERAAQPNLPALIPQPAAEPDVAEIERVAITVAENVAGHVQELILQIPADSGVPEFRGAIDRFMEERRIGEEQVVNTLATMQKALVRVLDRIDAIEMAQYRSATSGSIHAQEMRRPPQVSSTATMFPELYQEPVAAARRMPPPPEPTSRGPAKQILDPSNPAAVERARQDFKVDAKRARQKIANEFGDNVTVKFESSSKAGRALSSIGNAIGERRRLLAGAILMVVAVVSAGMILRPSLKVQNGVGSKIAAPAKPQPGTSGTGTHQTGTGGTGSGQTVTAIVPDTIEPAAAPNGAPATGATGTAAPSTPATGATPPASSPGPKADAASDKSLKPVELELQNPLHAPLGGELAKSTGNAAPASAAIPVAAKANEAVQVDDVPPPGNPNDLPPLTVGPQSLRLAAANGDPSAEFEVGARLAEGKGTEQNFKEAMRWYQRSATRGFAQAQYRLGTLYERGLGTAVDLGRARVWYQRAAEQGNVKAMHNLAVLSAGSANGQPDYPNAARWFRDAAERGLADSQFNIGVLHESGLGVDKDIKTAFKWFTLAAAGGDVEAGKRRDLVKGQLSTEELAAAQKLVNDFQPVKVDPIINDPRVAGEDWKARQGTTKKADGSSD